MRGFKRYGIRYWLPYSPLVIWEELPSWEALDARQTELMKLGFWTMGYLA